MFWLLLSSAYTASRPFLLLTAPLGWGCAMAYPFHQLESSVPAAFAPNILCTPSLLAGEVVSAQRKLTLSQPKPAQRHKLGVVIIILNFYIVMLCVEM